MSNEMPSIENICKAVNQLIEALMAATPAAASKRIASAAAALNLRLVAGDGGEGASDLVRRARNYTKSDYTGRLLNKLADRIEALEAELADLKKEREAVDALRKHEGTPTPEIMAWAEKTFMQAEIDDLKTQINILVNVGREVWSALQTNSDYTTAILSLADVLALHPPLTDRPALEAAAAQPSEREAALVKAVRTYIDADWMTATELADALRPYDTPAKDERRDIKRPDWKAIYEDCAHEDDAHDNDLVTVTRETVELASHALRKQNQNDFYHNYGAAERELMDVLAAHTPAKPDEAVAASIERLTAKLRSIESVTIIGMSSKEIDAPDTPTKDEHGEEAK